MIYWERFRDWIDWLKRPESGASFLMPGGISGNLQWNNSGAFDGVAGSQVSTIGELLLATPARTTPSLNYYFAVRTPADLALTGDTESIGIQLGGGANAATVTRQFTAGGGAFATQREIVCVGPTYSATAAETITNAATVAITAAPTAGSNMTLTNPYALWIQAGNFRFDGTLVQFAGATSSFPALKRSGGILQVRVGDDSDYASLQAQNLTAITNVQLNNSTSQLVGGVAGSFDVGLLRAAAGVWRITDSGATNGGGLIIGPSGATGAVGSLVVAPAARSGTQIPVVRVVTPADTALTASTESILIQYGGNTSAATVTRQFATGALTTQREHLFVNPTYGFVGASTLTSAATVAIAGAPAAGANATITNAYALWVQAGQSAFAGNICAPSVSGTDQAGSNLVFNPGRGTGTGAPGLPVIQYPLTTSTGTALQALSSNSFPIGTQMFLHNNGDITVSNTTETSLVGTADYGSKSLEAGLARVGRTWFIRLCGGLSVQAATTPTLQIRLKLGSTTVADTGAITIVSGASTANGGFTIEAVVTLRSVGATASVACHSLTVEYTTANGGTLNRFAQANIQAVDLTAAQDWDVTAQWVGASTHSVTIFSSEIYMDR